MTDSLLVNQLSYKQSYKFNYNPFTRFLFEIETTHTDRPYFMTCRTYVSNQ